MDELISSIKAITEMPAIEEGERILSPCFVVTPYEVGGLKGSGEYQESTVSCEIAFFLDTREASVSTAKNILEKLSKSGYACTKPMIEYEKNAGLWKVIILAEGVENEQ